MAVIIDYEQIEIDIVQKLSELGSDFEVEKLPESQSEFQQPFSRTKITVGYAGNKYNEPEAMGNIVQRTEVSVVLIFQGRKLRGPAGLYAALAQSGELLMGFEPTYCGKIFYKEQSPLEKDKDLFSFHQTIGCYTVLSETLPDLDEPNFSEISFERN